MAKPKAFKVTTKPAGKAPKLEVREGEQRSAVRVYELRAKSPADARKRVEEIEARIAEQEGGDAWKIDSAVAA